MGPQHPSTHGVLRVVLKLDGERVVDIDPVLGYLHRGVEKLCENADYHQTISQVDPLEYISSLFCEWAPVMAYEKLLDVEVPAPRRVHPGPLRRAQPDRQPRPVHGLVRARPRRPHADPVVVHRARRDRRDAGGADRPADALQLLPDRRRQRRPEPRVHEPPRRLDEPRGRARSSRTSTPAQRERDLRPAGERPRRRRHRDGAPVLHDRPEPARDRRPVRPPPDAPLLDLPRARVRHPDPDRGRLAWPATCSGWRRSSRASGSSTSASTRCPTARSWPSCRGCSARDPVARGPRSRGRAACTAPTRSATARTSRSG